MESHEITDTFGALGFFIEVQLRAGALSFWLWECRSESKKRGTNRVNIRKDKMSPLISADFSEVVLALLAPFLSHFRSLTEM